MPVAARVLQQRSSATRSIRKPLFLGLLIIGVAGGRPLTHPPLRGVEVGHCASSFLWAATRPATCSHASHESTAENVVKAVRMCIDRLLALLQRDVFTRKGEGRRVPPEQCSSISSGHLLQGLRRRTWKSLNSLSTTCGGRPRARKAWGTASRHLSGPPYLASYSACFYAGSLATRRLLSEIFK